MEPIRAADIAVPGTRASYQTRFALFVETFRGADKGGTFSFSSRQQGVGDPVQVTER